MGIALFSDYKSCTGCQKTPSAFCAGRIVVLHSEVQLEVRMLLVSSGSIRRHVLFIIRSQGMLGFAWRLGAL